MVKRKTFVGVLPDFGGDCRRQTSRMDAAHNRSGLYPAVTYSPRPDGGWSRRVQTEQEYFSMVDHFLDQLEARLIKKAKARFG